LCVVALVVLAMLNLPDATTARVKGVVRDGVSPLQAVLSGGMHELGDIYRYVRGVGDLAAENRALTERVTVLRGEVERMREIEDDNRALRDLMGFTAKSPQRLVACEVTGRDSTGWWRTVRLDKGRRGGVAARRAVITEDGLVGRTAGVGERTADVLLLTDPGCKVSVRLAETAVFGILSGTDDGGGGEVRCRMDYIPKEEAVEEGAEVVTTGLGGVFPRGLRVGTVAEVVPSEGGLYKTAWVEPLADVARLRYLFVIATEEDLAAAAPPGPDGLPGAGDDAYGDGPEAGADGPAEEGMDGEMTP